MKVKAVTGIRTIKKSHLWRPRFDTRVTLRGYKARTEESVMIRRLMGRMFRMATQEQIDALNAAVAANTDLVARVATLVGEDGMEIGRLKDRVAELEAAQGASDPATDAAVEAAKVAVEASNAVLDALMPKPVEAPVEAPAEAAAPAEAPAEAAPEAAPVEETPAAPAA